MRDLWKETSATRPQPRTGNCLRLLVLSDTHIGIDSASGRDQDFNRAYHRAIELAEQYDADALLHLGDLVYRSRVPQELFQFALAPLKALAVKGIHVAVVPGNHERSRIPQSLFDQHPRLQIFHQPSVFHWSIRGITLNIMGFPYMNRVGQVVNRLIRNLLCQRPAAELNLCCVHQCVEGASVGPAGYRFGSSYDVIATQQLPEGVDLFLSGHIHRAQFMDTGPTGQALPCPVLYPGSIERTSFAERTEQKGCCLLEWKLDQRKADGSLGAPQLYFLSLPTRPMHSFEFTEPWFDGEAFERELRGLARQLPENALVKLNFHTMPGRNCLPLIRKAQLKEIFGAQRIVTCRFLRNTQGHPITPPPDPPQGGSPTPTGLSISARG